MDEENILINIQNDIIKIIINLLRRNVALFQIYRNL